MLRDNGYLDLNDYYDKLVGTSDINVLKEKGYAEESDYFKFFYFLNINNKTYFFKYSNFGYREILTYLIAQDLGVNSVFYDMAILGNDKGVISESFRRENRTYFTASDLLEDYIKKEKDFIEELTSKKIPSNYQIDDYFSLELVWFALEAKYPSNKEDIERIMVELADQYMFKLLIGSSDAASYNVEFSYGDGKLEICPCFDNEYSLWPEHDDFLMTAEAGVLKDYYNNLKNFLSVSSSEFVERFLNMYSHFNNEYMCDIIKTLESTHDFVLEDEDKERILTYYDKIRSIVDSVLEELNIENPRRKNG